MVSFVVEEKFKKLVLSPYNYPNNKYCSIDIDVDNHPVVKASKGTLGEIFEQSCFVSRGIFVAIMKFLAGTLRYVSPKHPRHSLCGVHRFLLSHIREQDGTDSVARDVRYT